MFTKKQLIKFFLGLVAVFLVSGAISPINASAAVKPYNYTRIFYYQDSPSAWRSLFYYHRYIDVVAPKLYAFNDAGKLICDASSTNAAIVAFARQNKIKVMPLVTNRDYSQVSYQAILDNQATQDSAIASLVAEAKQYGYWGYQIDFEQMDASYKDKYSAFIKNAAAAMKRNGLVLSVAVVAKTSDNPADYPNDLWQKLIGAYDYSALAASADFISVMAYDNPSSKGPIAGYPWLQKVINYSLKSIPRNKLSLGIPLYYWQWNDKTGKLVGIGGRNGIYLALKKHRVAYNYSVKQEAPYLTYRKSAANYTIWYENARSIEEKISLIKKYRLNGFSAWALGLELPNIYNAL